MNRPHDPKGLPDGRGTTARRRQPQLESILLLAAGLLLSRVTLAQQAAPIADNSFLIEEAYNQEAGVVQHISALLWRRDAGAWLYTFTQEWPLFSQRSQASFTVPVQRSGGAGSVTRVSDVALNYRYQLAGVAGGVAVAPRLTLLLPTGREETATGSGGLGVQVNLPVSAALGPRLVAHGNAGATVTPAARNVLGDRATATAVNLGGSMIWLARPALNLLVEVAWTRSRAVTGPGATAPSEEWLVIPGVRGALDFAGGLQVVPGIGFPIGVGPSQGDAAVFFYLSFEHSFRSVKR